MGLLLPRNPDPPRRRRKGDGFRQLEEEEYAPPLRRGRSEPQAELAPADRCVDMLFATVQRAWRQHNRRLERETWARLIERLKELPPLRN